jgi:multidrug efflux pump subunit AcrB
MNPITLALRRPWTIMVLIVGVLVCALFALANLLPDRLRTSLPATGMPVDIFPDLKTPIIYVAQPYGGMDPAQMEGFLTYYYEYHFLYITGIHHVESKNIQGVALMKLFFHPGTNMAQAMAETVAYVNRSRSFMPPGTVPPFIMRYDAGSVPVGYLVFSSETKSIGEIQNLALNFVRPMFASLPGVSAPPPFGGNQRTVVITLKRDALNRHGMSPDEVVKAVAEDNQLTPSGNLTIGDKAPIVPVNSVVTDPKELGNIAIRKDHNPTVFLRDVGRVDISTDVATGYGLVNGRRSVYILVTKRADASTVNVVRTVKENLPRMQAVLPDDIKVRFEFDQSEYVKRSMGSVAWEMLLGAFLTGLMVLVFLRDWRSAIIVVLNIPFALLGAIVALWLTGETINLMTLGGLALAVGILVDEATVMVENIHTQMGRSSSIARAVRLANTETAVPRLLAMLCILAVFIPSFFMQGAARALFVPLALAVGFSMIASYLLSSTFVPVLSTWLLRGHYGPGQAAVEPRARLRDAVASGLGRVTALRWLLVPGYLAVTLLLALLLGGQLGMEIFPAVDAGQFQLRLRAPEGTSLDATEQLAKRALQAIGDEIGPDKVAITVSLVGTASYNYPINAIYLWTAGPHEAVLKVALKPGSGVSVPALKERLRERFRKLEGMDGVGISFEAGDIVEEVMSFGSPTRVEVAVSGQSLDENRAFAQKVFTRLAEIPSLRDLQYAQGFAYPTVEVNVDRERAGLSRVTIADVGRMTAPLTLSSRFTTPVYWRDPKNGIAYQVQVQVDQAGISSPRELGTIPVKRSGDKAILLQDVARIRENKMPGEYDRYNMRRLVSMTANLEGEDLGRVKQHVTRALAEVGAPPAGVQVDLRGQIVPMDQMFKGLAIGLALAVIAILLLLTANFQSVRLALIVISTAPAVIVGVALALWLTGTTLNIQSFMGAIMAIGVAVANAILLVSFAERSRRAGAPALAAAIEATRQRLRPILMTSFAMIAGMMPMALGWGEGGEQTAPLGRAVIGGLIAATLATLLVLPSVFALVLGSAARRSPSLDPDDPESALFDRAGVPPPQAAPATP